jgi:AcrR family transcriptional regulator
MRTKPASQSRSQDKQQRILAAMDGLLRTKPFASISVTELAAAAAVSPATIYQRFRNDDALGAVLLTLYFEKVHEWAHRPRPKKAGADKAGASEQLRTVAADAWDQVQALGYVIRPAYLYSRQYPERTGEDWKQAARMAREGFRGLVLRLAPGLSPRQAQRTADTLCDLFNFMLLGPLLHDEDPRWRAPRARRDFVDTMAALAHGYLTSGT